jgi:hypothetical protein
MRFPVPCSICLRIWTVARPFMPPPSIERIRRPFFATGLPLIARRKFSFSPKKFKTIHKNRSTHAMVTGLIMRKEVNQNYKQIYLELPEHVQPPC